MTSKESHALLLSDYASKYAIVKGNSNGYKIESIEIEDNLQYPGSDEAKVEEIKGMWEDYYKCLNKKKFVTIKPNMVHLIEGQGTEYV